MSDTYPANWYPDPAKRFELRYWDGSTWTEHVSTAGAMASDPLDLDKVSGQVGPDPSGDTEMPSRPSQADPGKVPIFGARKVAQQAQAENARLQALVDEHGLKDVAAIQAVRDQLASEAEWYRAAIARAQAQLAGVESDRQRVAQEIVNLREAILLQEFGVYDYEHPAENSVSLATELEAVRNEIKQAVRFGKATTATQNFTFNNSASKGRKFVNDMSKLMLRSYNAEAENCIKSVKAGNLAAARQRLSKTVEQVERLGSMINLQITPYYHHLRLRELELSARHLQALQVEREAERAHREELREQRRAEQELKAERQRLEKERSHYENAIKALEARGDIEGVERMRSQLTEIEVAIEDVDYRAANVRAGYVYVISNVGSFGSDVIKIGMTRRLEPMDRVQELGDASVPFRFDVHAMFFSDDAVGLENALHSKFADRRLNKVNLRREYFRATPTEVLEALKELNAEVLEFTLEPEAEEYRASLSADSS